MNKVYRSAVKHSYFKDEGYSHLRAEVIIKDGWWYRYFNARFRKRWLSQLSRPSCSKLWHKGL
jgi:hypothetical protein